MNKLSRCFEIGPAVTSEGIRNGLFHPTGPIEIDKKVKFLLMSQFATLLFVFEDGTVRSFELCYDTERLAYGKFWYEEVVVDLDSFHDDDLIECGLRTEEECSERRRKYQEKLEAQRYVSNYKKYLELKELFEKEEKSE